MNDNELKYLKWLENNKKQDNLLSATYSTTNGDTSSETFFAEANAMNEANVEEIEDYSENFPRHLIDDLFKAGD